ncbi:MAG: hypothetical protein ACTMUB_04235 [cyanobacterium endosymbiont of Rhopalodia musculus]
MNVQRINLTNADLSGAFLKKTGLNRAY